MARAFVFGDNVSTDALAPGAFMKGSMAELARHCLETEDPGFASAVKRGDIVVGGENFGMGSSREQAVGALVELGVGCVIAKSFAGLYFRNCFNLGLPAIACAAAGTIQPGEELEVDPATGRIDNRTRGTVLLGEPIPPHLLAMIRGGGLIAHLKQRFREMGSDPHSS